MEEFSFGDRVILTKDRDGATIGMEGTVIAGLERGDYGVKFDEPFDGGHSLGGGCESGYGHWIAPDEMKLINGANRMQKFKVGDIVKGTDPNAYGVTNTQMTRGRVTEVSEYGWLSVKVMEHDEQAWIGHEFVGLDPKYFDLVSSTEKPEFHVGQRVRIRSEESMKKEFGSLSNVTCLFTIGMIPLCGRTATIKRIHGKDVELKDWSDSANTIWRFSTDMLEPADKFEVGQIYHVGKLSCQHQQEDAIIRLAGNRPFGFTVKAIRGEAPEDFGTDSEYARSLTLLTGPQIGEAIRKYDTDRAEKKTEDFGEYREVRRAAKVGEKIKVVAPDITCGCYEAGDVLEVFETNEIGLPGVYAFTKKMHGTHSYRTSRPNAYIRDSEYVVLEPKIGVKEVKRHAKAGEYIKIVKAFANFGYENGDILLVTKEFNDSSVICKSANICVCDSEYVVLAGYKPENGKHIYGPEEIAEAKKFVLGTVSELAEKSTYILFDMAGKANDNYTAYIVGKGCTTEFDEDDLTIGGVKAGESKCSDNDEPNEWIGKAVALCKALHKPLPSFVQ